MADLIDEVVSAAVHFALDRLSAALQSLLATGDAFAQQLGVPVADVAASVTELGFAETDLAAAVTAVAVPDPKTAAEKLASCLGHVDNALKAVVPPPAKTLEGLLQEVAAPAAGAASGLATQLGLSADAALTHTGASLTVHRAAAGAASLGAGPVSATLSGIAVDATLNLGGPGPALSVTLTVDEASIGVAGGGISQLLLGSSAGVKARLVITITSDPSMHVGGGTAASVQLPAVTSGSPLQVKGVQLSAPAPGLPNAGGLDIGATVSAELAGATFVITGAGLRIGFDGSRLTLAPRPPDGVGISLDAGPVKGGGFLETRPTAGGGEAYGGALDLSLGFIELKAFGILGVGPPVGFSLIIVMTAEFEPAIELGLGFVLNGVGGLVGIQHVVDVDAIAAALIAHTLDSLLFPADPVTAAPRILDTLGSVFPVQSGGAVFGPMIKLGWGDPSFVTAELGVMLSLPDPVLVLIGRLKIQIPGEFLPIVRLTADLLGVITTEKLFIRAGLVDSNIGTFVIGGDFGLLIRYTGDPEFAMSAGGFHPSFTPPPELAGLARLSIDMSPPVVLTLRASVYAAITSATIQFGARVDIGIDLEVIDAEGHLSFDALIRFLPEFGFIADIDAGVSVHAFGFTLCAISAHLTLSGTSPWRIVGTGEADFGWFGSVSLDFGPLEWGDATKPPPVTIDVVAAVVDALKRPAAWTPVLPPGGSGIVHLRAFDPADAGAAVAVHPLGHIEARQNVLPLETEVTHIGSAVVAPAGGAPGKERLTFGQPTLVGAGVMPSFTSIDDRFAMGQFLDLNDADSLARPAFEERLCGVQIAPADFVSGTGKDELLTYETFVAGGTGEQPSQRTRVRETAFHYGRARVDVTLGQTAVSRSSLRDPYADLATGPVEPIVLADAADVVLRSPDTLLAVAGVSATPMSFTDAVEQAAAAGVSSGIALVRVGVAA